MKQLWKRMKREDGAAQMIEAALIYPVVFLCIFFLIYVGLYVLQIMAVTTYAQKAAMLTAREISYPGYISMLEGNESVYSDASVEGNEDLWTSLKLNTNPKKAKGQTYRYWTPTMMSGETKDKYVEILKEMVINHSIITSKSKDEIEVEIETENFFIVQYVTVNVSQPLMGFPVLEYFGIDTPVVKASAKTTVSDTDEMIRNVDFVTDALEAFANKIGLDIGAMKEKINEVKTMFGLD